MSKAKNDEKYCTKCNTKKKVKDDFYLAANDLISSDGRLNICKQCLSEIVDMNKVETLITAMRAVDRPFLKKTYDDSITSNKKPFGEYMRMLATPQNRQRTYLDSEFDGHMEEMIAKSSKDLNRTKTIEETVKFKVSPDILLKWGNYSESDLYQLENFYQSMTTANDITTPQHKESLKLLCKLNLEQNKALDEGRINDFKNLNTQYNKTLQDSGFRPIDRKSGGESAGVRTFSQIWEEIERDGFIEPYPHQEKQDIVDKTIMYMGNYTRKLVNMQSMSSPPSDTPKVEKVEENEL